MEYLLKKHCNILVTNACNLSCGGCNQHCGQFPPESIWHISPREFEVAIASLVEFVDEKRIKVIGVLGGEPTIHPEWDKLVEIMKSHSDTDFMIYTNGIKHEHLLDSTQKITRLEEDNLLWRIDPKHGIYGENRFFKPTLVSPQDIDKNPDRNHYWSLAQKQCPVWKNAGTSIHKGKAYFCEVAGAFDMLCNEDHGWDVEQGTDPMNRTEQELAEQASHFCYRCGFCLGEETQDITKPSLVTISNIPHVKKKRVHLTGQQWTFGIITNGGQRSRVQEAIDTIQDQRIDPQSYEIIIIGGEPHAETKHIPFNESIKPKWITRKKNLICQQAQFPNLCICHDYIKFEKDWYLNFLEFGDNWQVCMNQILNQDGSRFRDWILWGERYGNEPRQIKFIPYSNNEFTNKMYVSGTYFCVKKDFFSQHPLDESLCWGQGEDVEWSKRIRGFWDYRCNYKSKVSLLKQVPVDVGNLRLFI